MTTSKITYPERFDVIVVGGGHAGTEAALASARAGCATLLLTHNIETIGQMSCNPAIGGIGKSHIVREIDALGGAMAIAADQAGIQFRVLNARKGPAVQATRAQADRDLYRQAVRRMVENQTGLSLFQQSCDDLIMQNDRVCGVETGSGIRIFSSAVVLATGTFLGGIIHIGMENHAGGRAGDAAANRLARRLREMPFNVDRLKTGTPPRLAASSLDYSVMTPQPGDTPTPVFSYLGELTDHPRQVDCHITHTNVRTHDIIREGLDRSPLFTGKIDGVGPRYCPSVEDKVVRFADRDAHQIFVEPEGLNSAEIYPNGISTSLPFDIQYRLVRSIKGFESAVITRPGYAIEYDFLDPRDLRPWLETRFVGGLFFAGQINGTTGYEEAAGQGLIAGLNAARQVQGKQPWWPRRDQAYIGVMIDDLISRGTSEPYRMFTSRAEYRLTLRQDNADLRLTETGRELGLVDDFRYRVFEHKRTALDSERARLKALMVRPTNENREALERLLGQPLNRETRALDLLKRPGISYRALMGITGLGEPVAADAADQLEIEVRYSGYVDRQQDEIRRQQAQEEKPLPAELDYNMVKGLSAEVSQVLTSNRPHTVGMASRLPGVTPAAVSLLLVYLKKREMASAA